MPAKKLIKFRGEELGVNEWARKFNVPTATLATRLRNGWSLKDAVETPGERHYEAHGENLTLKQWSKKLSVPVTALRSRLQSGSSPELALTSTFPLVRHLTAQGVVMTIQQWADHLGTKRVTIDKRLVAGWSDEDAVMTPIGAVGVHPVLRFSEMRADHRARLVAKVIQPIHGNQVRTLV